MLFLLLTYPLSLYAEKLSLQDALNVHVHNTIYVKTKRLELENTLMEYDNFKKSYLPALSLNLTPVFFNHSMRLLQNYNTGEYRNVEEYSGQIIAGVSLTQKIPNTGGIFTICSTLSFLDEYTYDKHSFSSTPLCFSYTQPLLGGGKSQNFENAISELKHEVALKEFCTSISMEQQKILNLYLEAYSNKMDINLYSIIVNIGDSLIEHAKISKDVGKITEYEYNQIQIQQLDNKSIFGKSQYAYKSSIRLLENELLSYDIEVEDFSTTSLPTNIDGETVLKLAYKNNPQFQELEIERINAEYMSHITKISNRFNADISLSYGFNQYAPTFKGAYCQPGKQQTASITLNVPIFQWGVSRNKIKIAQNEHKAILLGQELTLDDFEKEIQDCVFNYNMNRGLLEVAEKKYKLSGQQYFFASHRFKLGIITTLELTTANKDFLQAKQNYMSVLKDLFINYYKIRHISLHDFTEDKDLMELFQISF
jgi:hypothetical protein